MQEFWKISIILALYGVFKEFRPGEPYLVPYMTEPPLNFTSEEVSQEIFPASTYSTLVLLIVVFLVTDFLRYKVVIIAQVVSAIATYLMLIVCRGVFQMQLMQVVYGLYLAAEVAYFTYIYAKVDKAQFQEVTSYTRSAYLFGRCLSGIASQVAVYYDLTSYMGLMWITIGSEVIALIWATLLPPVDRSMYFHRNMTTAEDKTQDKEKAASTTHSFRTVVRFLWTDFKTAFTNPYVLKWALWWVLASGGYFMVTSFVQVLWQAVRHKEDVQLNGAVETVYTLLGALASIVMGRVQLDWRALGEPLLAVCSLVASVTLYVMSGTESSAVAYGGFILFTVIFQTMITVANSEVAKNVNKESYGLVFGITTFGVYAVLSLFFYIALQVFQLAVREQFEVYAVYYGVMGFVFLVAIVVRFILSKL